MDCVREIGALRHKMSPVPHIVHWTHTLHIPFAPSRPNVKTVPTNYTGRVLGHFLEPHSTYDTPLLHAALRNHAYTALRSLTCLQPHLYGLVDYRRVPSRLALILCDLGATFHFPSPRGVLEAAVQFLSRAVFQVDENPVPGLGHVRPLFCGVIRAYLETDHDVLHPGVQ